MIFFKSRMAAPQFHTVVNETKHESNHVFFYSDEQTKRGILILFYE